MPCLSRSESRSRTKLLYHTTCESTSSHAFQWSLMFSYLLDDAKYANVKLVQRILDFLSHAVMESTEDVFVSILANSRAQLIAVISRITDLCTGWSVGCVCGCCLTVYRGQNRRNQSAVGELGGGHVSPEPEQIHSHLLGATLQARQHNPSDPRRSDTRVECATAERTGTPDTLVIATAVENDVTSWVSGVDQLHYACVWAACSGAFNTPGIPRTAAPPRISSAVYHSIIVSHSASDQH